MKITLTDSICIAKFTILKPQIEVEVNGIDPHNLNQVEEATEIVLRSLNEVVKTQLETIAARMSVSEKKIALASVEVDRRFQEIVRRIG